MRAIRNLQDAEIVTRQLDSRLNSISQQIGASGSVSSLLSTLAYSSVNQPIPDGTETVLYFDTNKYDIGNLHIVGTNNSRFTCRVPGIHLIHGQLSLLSGPAVVELFVRVNGNDVIPLMTNLNENVNGDYICQIQGLIRLGIGDYIEFYVFHDAGADRDALASETWGALTLLIPVATSAQGSNTPIVVTRLFNTTLFNTTTFN